ncbi:30S ribosomal protein S3 [Patescibacteria group bacterium]|nr:30S ribosomal protein S3 [Patescibacteria group bacterium]MBU1563860.1 30S ribosomal protein S3 [Patescibacteria group bacterium]
MGRKVHPFIFRIGTVNTWKSRWFNQKRYKNLLEQDIKLRNFVAKKLIKASINSIEIERSANLVNIIIFTAKPGLVIGRGGSGVEDLKQELRKIIHQIDPESAKTDIRLEVEEIRQPNSKAAIVAQDMAMQIEKRMPYRRVIKQTLDKIMQNHEVQGAKIMINGRLNGAEIARKEWLKKGRISLQTLRANIDYANATAYTTYGTIGVKVWICKGEVFDKDKK